MIEEDFNCDHSNGCTFHCTQHLKKSCESLADGVKLIVQNPGFKNYEIPIFDTETYGFLAKYEIKPIENILNEIYLIPLQFVIENVTEISEECLRLLINPCWKLLLSKDTRTYQQAAVIILLASQKFKTDMSRFINRKLTGSLSYDSKKL